MSLVPLMILAQTAKVKAFVIQNQRPLFNVAMGVLTFSLSFQVMRKEYTNRELRERLAVSDAHSRAVIAALHDGEWIARAAGAARGGGAEALRAELHGVLLPRREGAGAAGPALATAMRVPVVAAGGGSAVAAGAVAAAAGAGKAAAAEPVAGAAGAGSGSAAGAAASEGTAAGAPAPAAPTPAAAAAPTGKARPFI